MPKCPGCGRENPAGTPICAGCGDTLPEISQPAADTVAAPAEIDPVEAEILDLLKAGKKIAAIKEYRERVANVGLKEAKEAVEALAAQHGIQAQASGCAGSVLLAIAATLGAAWLVA